MPTRFCTYRINLIPPISGADVGYFSLHGTLISFFNTLIFKLRNLQVLVGLAIKPPKSNFHESKLRVLYLSK